MDQYNSQCVQSSPRSVSQCPWPPTVITRASTAALFKASSVIVGVPM
ncbi:hypothetical protein G3I15_42075 [Streptomyces sp. SID10244]|nr:hypothetical protein [Streptomyces sp. SID10244]